MLEEPSLPTRTGRAAFNVPRKAISASTRNQGDDDDDEDDLIPPLSTRARSTGRGGGAIKDRDIGGGTGLGLRGGRDLDMDDNSKSTSRPSALGLGRGIGGDFDMGGGGGGSRGAAGRGIGFGSSARDGTRSTAMSRSFGGTRGRGMSNQQPSSDGDDFYMFHQFVSETSPVVHATWLSCVLFMLCVCLTILSAALYVMAKKDHPLPTGQDSNLELILKTVPLDRYFVLMIFLSLMAVYWLCSWLVLLCYRYNWKRGKVNGWVYDHVARHDSAGR